MAFVNFWIHLYAFTAFVPYLWFFVLWFVVYLWQRDGKRATKLAMDVTTFLLIGSVSSMYANVFHNSFGFYFILLFFLIGYGLIGNYQYRLRGKLNHRKIIRILWRLGFILLSLAYFLLLIIGIIQRLLEV
ncbi:DUF3397 family protein [Paenibacillus koleovorans]|uniref:DUF3397 family protein n=1 Tax=Paenibacillus koleovorans TaxID=121608 RepID=UPI000FDB521A|nr:DUF3397 family protein [Paenibacillus koleovorans]